MFIVFTSHTCQEKDGAPLAGLRDRKDRRTPPGDVMHVRTYVHVYSWIFYCVHADLFAATEKDHAYCTQVYNEAIRHYLQSSRQQSKVSRLQATAALFLQIQEIPVAKVRRSAVPQQHL